MNAHAVGLDVGGTSIDSGIVSVSGDVLPGSLLSTAIDSKAGAEEILSTLAEPISKELDHAAGEGIRIRGIGIGFPGPCDYEAGICLIKDLDKYGALYGVDVGREIRTRLRLDESMPVCFEIDAWTFVRGEAWKGAGAGHERIIGFTLGTGLGSGFLVHDEMVDSGPGVPRWGWIGGLPYGKGILDDRVSRRGILARYLELGGAGPSGLDVCDIAARAREGEDAAVEAFRETGEVLGRYLRDVSSRFEPDCIVAGGRISRSYDLFGPALERELPPSVEIGPAHDIEGSAILGAARFLFRRAAGHDASDDE